MITPTLKTTAFFALFFIGTLLAFLPIREGHSVSDPSLKGYMFTFVGLAAELRMEDIKGKNPQWEPIRQTLQKMDQNLEAMRRSDVSGRYKTYLEEMAFSLSQMKRMSQARSPKISKQFDRLTQSCLRCHSAHLSKESQLFKEGLE